MFTRRYIFTVALLTSSLFASALFAQRSTGKASSGKTSGQQYKIRYKLRTGETLVSRVEHFAETRTTMADHEEESSSRTITEKAWEVLSVNAKGEMTFVYRINSVNMAQSVGEAEEIKYDSRSDAEAPGIFKQVAATIEKPLATVTINSMGQVLNRDKERETPQLGIGELTIPLPEAPVAIGGQWEVPRKLRVRLTSGAHKTIKVRELYTLAKVSAGVATISIVTQPLTPITDPAIDSQLVQQLSKGEIKFDLDRGRMLSKHLEWDEEVIGFRGAGTTQKFDAKYTEKLLPESRRSASRNSKRVK